MKGMRLKTVSGRVWAGPFVCLGTFGASTAQDLSTDAQIQAAFGTVYNHLGLMEYCASKGYASVGDVANARKAAAAAIMGMNTTAVARAQEQVGVRGTIVGRQLVGLMDPANPAHPEMVRDGETMSLADNARAQHTTEQALCRQMAEQVAPLP